MILSNERAIASIGFGTGSLDTWTFGLLLICCVHSYLYGIVLRDCIYGFYSPRFIRYRRG
jgi:hypothetical protein